MSRTHQHKTRYLALPIKLNPKDSSAMYLVMNPKNSTLYEVMLTVVMVDMDMAEAEKIDPNQEI